MDGHVYSYFIFVYESGGLVVGEEGFEPLYIRKLLLIKQRKKNLCFPPSETTHIIKSSLKTLYLCTCADRWDIVTILEIYICYTLRPNFISTIRIFLLSQVFNLLSCVYILKIVIFKLHFGHNTFSIYFTMLSPFNQFFVHF
jgi:hypothetical protein